MPSSAMTILLVPSKANGLVTTATVKAPASLANSAIKGVPPVPVPPPMPQVKKTMSVSIKRSLSFSWDSDAAWRPTSGSAPEPKPSVRISPICIFALDWEFIKA